MTMPGWDTTYGIITQYWLLPIGMLVIYFFARYHFNTPDYALTGLSLPDSMSTDLPKNAPSARLRTPAPPIFTTPRDRYRRAELQYIFGLEVFFLCLTLFPDLFSAIPNLQGAKEFLANSFNDRVIVGTLLLTGFLSSFPVVREFDAWLLKNLHVQASIPDDAEQTADELFEIGYIRNRDVLNNVLKSIQTPLFRAVASGTVQGRLEARWLDVRCLLDALRDKVRGQEDERYRPFYRKFGAEFQDVSAAVNRLRPAVIAYAAEQVLLVPQDVTDIDNWFEQNTNNPNIQNLKATREKVIFDLDAMYYRICLFTSLAAYAVEPTLMRINRFLNGLGFPIEVVLPPKKPWDVILIGGFVTLGVCLCLSLLYTVVVQGWPVNVPENYKADVPDDLKEAGIWALTAAILHTVAAAAAVLLTIRELKARRADGRDLLPNDPFTRRIVVATFSSVVPIGILAGYALAAGRSLEILCWVVLPFITAYFSGGYIRWSVTHVGEPSRGFIRQSIAMGVAGLILTIILIPNSPVNTWPPIVWVFAAYVTVTASGIGLTLGWVFCRNLISNIDTASPTDESVSSRRLTFHPTRLLES